MFYLWSVRRRASLFGEKGETQQVRDMSSPAFSPIAYSFGVVVLFGKELGLIFLVPALALREASFLFFSIKTSGFVDPFSSHGKIIRFPSF
jgi:hypothetical protein